MTATGAMTIPPTLEVTEDGSATLRSPLYGDTYHSMRGAVGEARHVFIEAGLGVAVTRDGSAGLWIGPAPVCILEAGFGTGLNAWLTLSEAERSGLRVEYTAVELHPVPMETVMRLGYTDDSRFEAMHRAPWGERTAIAEGFGLWKLHADMSAIDLRGAEPAGGFDLVYYDAFAPDTQPEMWTREIFARIFAATAPGGVLVTYSAKGDVRRALQSAGYEVEKLSGALGKRHMLRARKTV